MAQSILLVEDDATLIRSIARNLVARGYTTRNAATVTEALALLDAERPTLALLDIDLPDGSGWEILRALRAQPGAPVAAIVMSALRPNPRLCDELHADGVLEKPFPMEALVRLVARHTERAAAPIPADSGADQGIS